MITLGLIISFVLSAGYFFVESVRNGMAKKRWVVAGIIFGPMMLPMFAMSKHLAWRKATGFNNVFFRA